MASFTGAGNKEWTNEKIITTLTAAERFVFVWAYESSSQALLKSITRRVVISFLSYITLILPYLRLLLCLRPLFFSIFHPNTVRQVYPMVLNFTYLHVNKILRWESRALVTSVFRISPLWSFFLDCFYSISSFL